MYIHFELVHRVGDSFVSLLLCGSCIIRVTTHGHQCVSWTREKLRAGMYLRMQVRIQPHPVGSPLGVGDFSRISHGLSRTIGCKIQGVTYSFSMISKSCFEGNTQNHMNQIPSHQSICLIELAPRTEQVLGELPWTEQVQGGSSLGLNKSQ